LDEYRGIPTLSGTGVINGLENLLTLLGSAFLSHGFVQFVRQQQKTDMQSSADHLDVLDCEVLCDDRRRDALRLL
jgi:hypothetical protein